MAYYLIEGREKTGDDVVARVIIEIADQPPAHPAEVEHLIDDAARRWMSANGYQSPIIARVHSVDHVVAMTSEQLKVAGRQAGSTFARENSANNADWVESMASETPNISEADFPFTYNFRVAVYEYMQEQKSED